MLLAFAKIGSNQCSRILISAPPDNALGIPNKPPKTDRIAKIHKGNVIVNGDS